MTGLRYRLPLDGTQVLKSDNTLTVSYRDFLLEVETRLKPQIAKIEKLDSGATNTEIITTLNEIIDGLIALKIMEK